MTSAIMSWNFLLLFSALYLDLLEGLRLLCSGGSSKAGHTLTRRQMKWLPSTSLMHTLLLFERKNSEILQGSSGRVTSERRLRRIFEIEFNLPVWCKGSKSFFQAP